MNDGLSIKDIDPSELTELNNIKIDCDVPIAERIMNFIINSKSSNMFQVNGRAVIVVFDSYARSSLEDALTNALRNILLSKS